MKTTPTLHTPSPLMEGGSSPHGMTNKESRLTRLAFYFLMAMLALSLIYFILLPLFI
jgi:hypothetical protein